MKLINTTTFELKQFPGGQITEIPKYAILSHRWETEEVHFDDPTIEPGKRKLDRDGNKKGYYKIFKACHQAKAENLDYLWCDTCCINKSDSSELSEAINSMYS